MATADAKGRSSLAWLLVLAAPVAAAQGPAAAVAPAPASQAAALPEPGLLEFLAEEPALGDDLNDAVVATDAATAPASPTGKDEVKHDDAQPQ